jgi:hypothetical protein
MVAVPSVLPLETGMQIEVHYVWPIQFLIDCAVRLKTLAPILRRPAGVHRPMTRRGFSGGVSVPCGIDRDAGTCSLTK